MKEKVFALLFTILSFVLSLSSCSKEEFDGYQEEIAKTLVGSWEIYIGEECQGTISFTKDETFTMTSKRGNIEIGNYGEYDDNMICIFWAEDCDGNVLIGEDENGDDLCYCSYIFKTPLYCVIDNLPFYKDEKIILNKIK